MIAFRGLWVGGVALAMRHIVKRRQRPPEAAKSDPAGGFAGPSDVVARPS